VVKGLKVLDAQGEELPDGLKAKGLAAGAEVTLTVEREGDKPVIMAIKLGKPPAKQDEPKAVEKMDTSHLRPLTDLGKGEYQGFKGGLSPDAKNERPAGHEAAGVALARQVRPLDADGKPSADGKIVLLGVGFSNTVQAFNGFMQVARADKAVNPNLV